MHAEEIQKAGAMARRSMRCRAGTKSRQMLRGERQEGSESGELEERSRRIQQLECEQQN